MMIQRLSKQGNGILICLGLVLSLYLIRPLALFDVNIANIGVTRTLASMRYLDVVMLNVGKQNAAYVDSLPIRNMRCPNARICVAFGWQNWVLGQWESALQYWKLALQLQPDDPFTRLRIADILYHSGADKEAIAIYDSIGAATLLYHRGQLLEQDGLLDEAVEQYKVSLSLSVSDKAITALRSAAAEYAMQGAEERSRDIWAFLVANLSEDEPFFWWAVAELYESDARWIEAIEAFETGASLAIEPYKFYMQAADASRQAQFYHLAYQYYLLALERRPENVHIYLSLGNVAKMFYDNSLALSWYQKARRLDPANYLPLYYEGVLYFDQGLYDLAKKTLSQSLQSNPGSNQVLFYLARTMYHLGEEDQAIRYLETVIKLKGDFYCRSLLLLSDWYLDIGETDKACDSYSLLHGAEVCGYDNRNFYSYLDFCH